MSAGKFEPVRIGVAGVGGFGLLHALTLQGIAEAELVAVTHRRQNRLDEIAGDLPGVPAWTQLDKAVTESDAQAWIVASSTAAHVPMTRTILEAGKPVLLEKPLAADLAEAQSLSSLVASDSSNLMLGHILLFNSEFRQLVDETRQRGPIAYLNSVRHRPVTTMEILPGESPLHLLMVHDLYMTQVLADRKDPIKYDCRYHRCSSGDIDLAVGLLQWENGMLADLTASFMTTAGMASDGFDRLELFGEGWSARLDPNPRPMELWDERARRPMALEIRADPIAPSGMMAEELRCFCRVVRGIEPVPVGATYQDAMQVQQWLDKLESAAGSK